MEMEMEARKRLGSRLRTLREGEGYKLAEFSERLGIDPSGLSRMERGERGIDTLFLRRAADVLGVGLDAFFPATEPRVVLARDGGGGDERMNEAIEWTKDLHRDLELVARFGGDPAV